MLGRGSLLLTACTREQDGLWVTSLLKSRHWQCYSILKRSLFETAYSITDNIETILFAHVIRSSHDEE